MKSSPFAVERRGLRVGDPAQAIGQTRLRVLGQFSLELAHVTTPGLSTQKARAVLAYLVAHRESDVARERLLDMFWPDATPEAARDSLRSALWSIRRIIRDVGLQPDDYIAASRTVVRWKSPSWLDCESFEELAKSDDALDLEAAADLYRGDFLEGDYDNWTVSQRTRFERIYDSVLERLVLRYGHQDAAQLLLSRNAYHEPSYALLIQQELQAGRVIAAAALAAQCERALAELALQPSEDLRRLISSISTRRAESIPRIVLPFAGRGIELASIRSCLARTSRARIILICGEAGIGKSALLAQAAVLASSMSLATACVRCTSNDLRRFGAFEDLLPAAAHGADRRRLIAHSITESGQFIDTILDFAVHGGVLTLDDAHNLTGDSLSVFSEFAKRSQSRNALLLIACRLEGLENVQEALRGCEYETLFLGPLPYDDLRAAIESVVRGDGASVAQTVYERSGGHPLFAGSLVDALAQSGVLRSEDGSWQLRGPLTGKFPLPKTLTNYIRSRLLATGKQGAAVAAALALEPNASSDDLAYVLQVSDDDVLCAIDDLLLFGVLATQEPGARVHFTHDLYREVAVNAIGAGRRTRMHRAFAERFRECPKAETFILRARHLAEAGDAIYAARAYCDAGAQALQAGEPIDALRYCEDGFAQLQSTERAAVRDACSAALTMLAAQANAATGKINEALTGAHHAAAIAKRLNDTGTFADAALLRDRLLLDLFDNAAVAAGSKELIAVLQLSNSPAKLSTALSNWACAERALGNEAAAAQAAADAERVVIDTGDEDAACYALVQKILTAITWWHFSEAAGAAERVSAIAPHAGAVARAAVSCALGSFHLAANQYTEARSAIDTARVLVQEAHELFVPAQWRPFRLSAIILGLESACARLALTRDDARGALDAAGRLLLIGSSRSRALAFAFGADAFFLSGDRRMLADRTMRDRAHESFSQDVDSGSRSVQFAYTLIAAATAAPDARRHVRESLDMLEDAAQRTPLEADLAFARLARAAELCGAEHVARRAALRCRDYGAARMLAVSRIAGATAVLPKNT